MTERDSDNLANVLLVDDSQADITLSQAMLDHGQIRLNLHAVQGGREAVSYLRRQYPFEDAVRPDVVLLDLNMPDIDGKETLAIIQQDHELKDIPVVIFSSSDAEKDIRETKALGAAEYVTKPLSYQKLQQIIGSVNQLAIQERGHEKLLCRAGS